MCVREHSYASKTLIDTDVWLLVENISYCDLVCHLWQRSIIQWVAFFQGSRCVCGCVCVCCVCVCVVCVLCVCVWLCGGVVVVSLAQGLRVLSSSLTPRQFSILFSTCLSPTSPPSCDWVPDIYWVANSRPFLMKQQWSRWDFAYIACCEERPVLLREFLARL